MAGDRVSEATSTPGGRCGSALAALTSREALLVDALAERVVELLRPEPAHLLVDAATLAGALGVDRSYIYAHADELGVVRLGGGSKPRLRFDLEAAREAMARYASKHSQGSNASTGAESAALPARRRRHLPNRLPEPGSILTAKPSPRT
jgi:hypothetical protein